MTAKRQRRPEDDQLKGHTHDTHALDEDWDDEEDEVKSKTQLKKEMIELQKLAKSLTELSRDQLKKVPLDEDLREAITATSKVRGHEGLRRHMQYLGRIMRRLDEEDVKLIVNQLEVFTGASKAETAKLHRIERLREKLLSSDVALTELISQHPQIDAQAFRTLIRNARREQEQNKPPKAYREIYQVLRGLQESSVKPSTPEDIDEL